MGSTVQALTDAGELLRLEIPAQPAFVGVARSVVIAVAGAVDGIDDDRLEDLRVAVSEACTNAVEAHRRDAVNERVVIRCVTRDTRFEVCIEDSGRGFDPQAVPPAPGPDAMPSASSESGWGIQLIQSLVDDVRFRQTADGTAVDLMMHLGASPPDSTDGS